jgi:thiol-disulfide isomerase/thioredoxin
MKRISILCIVCNFFFASLLLAQKKNTIFLTGEALNFSNQVQVADFSAVSSFLLPNTERIFIPDSAHKFQLSFTLNKPGYFRIGRNVLYLSPGDSLHMKIDYLDGKKGVFNGKGAEANYYLRNTPFPKAASYLRAGDEIKNNLSNTLLHIEAIADNRKKELLTSKNLSATFVKLELGRIKADMINSLEGLKSYCYDVFPKDSIKGFLQEHKLTAEPMIKKYATGFYDASLLELEVYRDILDVLQKYNTRAITVGKAGKLIEEWQTAYKLSNRLKRFSNKDSVRSLKPAISKLTNSHYKKLLLEVHNVKVEYGNGDAARNFAALTEKDEKVWLEKYKGAVIYVDMWATWCGPCLEEMPHYNKLKEIYKDKNIVFISLSIDSDTAEWKNYLQLKNATGHQWVIDRLKLKDYAVTYVPRTIIIDKNFTVVDLYAPNPSSSKTQQLLNKLLE